MIVAFCLLHILLQNLSLEQGALNLLLLIRKFMEGILFTLFCFVFFILHVVWLQINPDGRNATLLAC